MAYALVSVEGKRVGGDAQAVAPRLTAQCTRDAQGKLRFELLADAGGVADLRFVPPWKPVNRDDLFPPRLPHATVTMEFLGYTKVKPMKRQWTALAGQPEEWKYISPGAAGSNMEQEAYYLRYLRALPTLRLTWPSEVAGKPPVVAEFETAAWQARIKAEPLCAASGL